jgi:hypothetical protein
VTKHRSPGAGDAGRGETGSNSTCHVITDVRSPQVPPNVLPWTGPCVIDVAARMMTTEYGMTLREAELWIAVWFDPDTELTITDGILTVIGGEADITEPLMDAAARIIVNKITGRMLK